MSLNLKGADPETAKAMSDAWARASAHQFWARTVAILGVLAFVAFCVHTCGGAG